jgi:phosphotransferase system enzyme I (PtsP)
MTPAKTQESSLLLTLEEISQLVSHSHDPRETLANIVGLIQERFHTDVCSVYLLEAEREELVLGATVGLNPAGVGSVRMRLDEGLTGLVAEQLVPVMVNDAFQHPRFRYFPEAGEDPYHSFLGVPLLEGGVLQGVLVVQTVEPRSFSANETRMLVTVASQLAPLVSGARLLEQVVTAAHAEPCTATPASGVSSEHVFRGASLSAGVGLGEAYIGNGFGEWHAGQRSAGAATEAHRLVRAMEAAREELTRLSRRISALVGESHGAILQAQLMMMQDRSIERDLADCLAAGATAEGALLQTLEKYVAAFQKVATPLFQERVFDIKDVFRRLLWHLRPGSAASDSAAGRLILVAHEASVMDFFSLDLDRLAGVVVERGGPQSHAAILARSLGVPMVGQLPDVVGRLKPGRHLLVDGTAGAVILDPAPATLEHHKTQLAPVTLHSQEPAEVADNPDGPRLEANINLLCEVSEAVRLRAAGVGLFRSEFLFLARRSLPTEEEQVGIYRKLLEMLEGRPASIRTFDLRPDKLAHCTHLSSAASGPLDWRQVLVSPPLQKLFKDQVRAILRAAYAGPARIVIPLVTRTEHLDFVIDTLAQARAELAREKLEHATHVPLGIMIEVAAAAAMVENWAAKVDFFALGTNDLAASALGIDRDDPLSAAHNDPLHPGLLRMIGEVVAAAHHAGARVTVCGEMAADPEGALALTALQVDSLSVAVNLLLPVRRLLADNPAPVADLGPQLCHLGTARQVRELLRDFACGVRSETSVQAPA